MDQLSLSSERSQKRQDSNTGLLAHAVVLISQTVHPQEQVIKTQKRTVNPKLAQTDFFCFIIWNINKNDC